jgi:hypothetical protein
LLPFCTIFDAMVRRPSWAVAYFKVTYARFQQWAKYR